MHPLPRIVPHLLLIALATLVSPVASEETTALQAIPGRLENAEGRKMESAELDGKYIGLYFSAGWCPPCRAFTPRLVEFRNAHAEEFEVVFVSFDKSNTEKQQYIRKSGMPWPSIPGAGRKDAKALSQKFQVQGLPTLIILAPDGSVASLAGREDVMSSPEAAFETWKKASQS